MTGEGLERGLTCGQGDISDGDMDIFIGQSQTMNGEWLSLRQRRRGSR